MNNDGPTAIENQLFQSQIVALGQLLDVYEKSALDKTDELCTEIAERKRSAEALCISRLKLLNAMDLAHVVYWEIDPVAQTYVFNDPFYAFYGTTAEQEGGYLVSAEDYAKRFIHPDDLPLYYQFVKESTLKPGAELFADLEHRIVRRDGEVRHIQVRTRLIRDDSGRIVKGFGANQDITERKRSVEALHISQLQLLNAMDLAHIVYWEFDPVAQTYIFNDPFYAFYGTTAEQEGGYLVSREDYGKRFIHPDDLPLYHQFVKENTLKQVTDLFTDVEHRIVRRNGEVRHIQARTRVIKDDSGHIVKRYGANQDITERKLAEEKIQYLATHDSLTGLPNRLMFSQLLNHAIQAAQRYHRLLAVLFVDLDRFKIVNDTLGHKAGDQLLQEIAPRLKQALRAVDVVARLGGDEFVILIEEVNNSNQVAIIAHNILTSILKPIALMGQECRITGSIGISMYPKDAKDEQSLMKNADIAMYFAKEEGKNNYQFYSEDIQSKSLSALCP
jgi:diguanylate cyclase (GGDEF)-like protein/PAS domain S-box-containing protein